MRCFAGGWPRAFCSSVVDAAAASFYSDSMAHHTDGWLRPNNAAKLLSHASSGLNPDNGCIISLFAVINYNVITTSVTAILLPVFVRQKEYLEQTFQ